jgi:hypothetical protein
MNPEKPNTLKRCDGFASDIVGMIMPRLKTGEIHWGICGSFELYGIEWYVH